MANIWNVPTKAVAVSTGVVSVAVILKLSLPVMLDFLTFELPLLWSFALSWLQPPYLYLLVNCIIISIVASSKLQPCAAATDGLEEEALAKFPGDEVAVVLKDAAAVVVEEEEVEDPVEEVVFGCVDDDEKKAELAAEGERGGGGCSDGGGEFVVKKSMWTPPKTPVSSAEKLPYSARFGHRKTVKSSPEGKAMLKVSRPKRQEALESTWRTITDGRPMPLTRRHLRKSDTFTATGSCSASQDTSSPVRAFQNSDTFSGGTSSGNSSPASNSSGGKLRRESSLSQDELNRRVEAFIKKFNDEMRMQRQESLSHYREMVTR